jgi:hypothetical protein
MKLLIIGGMHFKNKIGLELLLSELNIDYKYGNFNDINNYDIIYSPSTPINVDLYPHKKFLFGPHISIFPDNRLLVIKNSFKNAIYIQPSEWVSTFWTKLNTNVNLDIKYFPFSVQINKFKPENISKTEVFIYYKRRKLSELNLVTKFLDNKNIKYNIFNYLKKYNEDDYLKFLKKSRYGIIIGAHESQGFAIEEALSCNVPLLVWNSKSMNQEEGSNFPDIECTSIPYWDNRCGEFFHIEQEFEKTYNKFINNIENYNPREYILENLSPIKCSERFKELINNF